MKTEACETVRTHLDSYLSNELPPQSSRDVARHLESCHSCSHELENRARVKSLLRDAVRREEAPAYLERKIRLQVRDYEAHRFVFWMRPVAAFAMFLIVCAGGWFAYQRLRTGGALPPRAEQDAYIRKLSAKLSDVLRIGLKDHVHCSVFRKYPKNGPSAAEMAARLGLGYADLAPALKQAVPENYRIVLAHKCGYDGRNFVHLTVKDGSRLLSLVITKKDPGESFEKDKLIPALERSGVAIYRDGVQRFEVAGFESRDHLAFVVSDLKKEKNLEIAAALAPSVRSILARLES